MKVTPFEISDYLKTEQDMAEYLSAVMESGNTEATLAAIADIAKARGMTKLAEASGLNRESLYKALRPGAKPRFDTVCRIMAALNLRISAVPTADYSI